MRADPTSALRVLTTHGCITYLRDNVLRKRAALAYSARQVDRRCVDCMQLGPALANKM